MASAMTVVRPVAAAGVSSGRIRVAAGSSRPMAPRSSQTPMTRTSGAGTSIDQLRTDWRAVPLVAIFFQPAIPKTAANEH